MDCRCNILFPDFLFVLFFFRHNYLEVIAICLIPVFPVLVISVSGWPGIFVKRGGQDVVGASSTQSPQKFAVVFVSFMTCYKGRAPQNPKIQAQKQRERECKTARLAPLAMAGNILLRLQTLTKRGPRSVVRRR